MDIKLEENSLMTFILKETEYYDVNNNKEPRLRTILAMKIRWSVVMALRFLLHAEVFAIMFFFKMTLDSVRTLKKLRLWQITSPVKTTSDVTSDIPNWLVARQVYSPALSSFTFPMERHPSCWKYGSKARAVPDRDHTTWPSASQQSFTVDPMAAKTWGGGFLVNIGDAASAKEIMRIFF